ncbi:glycosyltransferase [Nocardiopsis alba]|uniref:glycosyltransferase n=1 Tax=Nocardiopsis alba TaxID=53437 RepID=UPI0033F3E82A
MRISLIVTGSRGDVQPFIALGRAFTARGHDVTIATQEDFRELVREAELGYTPLPGSPRDFMAHPALAEALQKGASLFRAARAVPKQSTEATIELAARVAAAAEGADLVVNSVLTYVVSDNGDSVPWASVAWWPLNPTSRWPAMISPQVRLGRLYNRSTHLLAALVESILVRPHRRNTGLSPLPSFGPYRDLGRAVPLMCPITREMFTEPDDWPELSHITGYWFWDRQWTPSQELIDFYEAGEPPVALSFGSIWPVHQPERTLDKVLGVVRRHGRRLVLIGGGPKEVPDDVLRVDDVHYPWLFPRSAAIIHHGGCNTTGEALRSGTPQVIVPTFGDSPFWAAHAHRLGAAPKPVPYPKFTAERLDHALDIALNDRALRHRASELGEAVRAERGAENAAELLEEWARKWRTAHGDARAI